ncbi:MAG TPA: class I SAM-dependent methyltransferase [Candidatus Saccharibacteria bacterium]|nr:class I SAM-dependent methyltransferase [Candidatus Saccharibacteria bacterium]
MHHIDSEFAVDSLSGPGSLSGFGERFESRQSNNPALVEVLKNDERIDEVPIVRVKVHDLYAPTSEQELRDYWDIRSRIAAIEDALRSEDSGIVENGLATGRALLDANPTILAWKKMMTTAMALHPLQRPHTDRLLDEEGTEVNSDARKLFLYGQEATIIRSRGAIFSWRMGLRDGDIKNGVGLGGGAAVPECDAIAKMLLQPFMTYVDMDEKALKHIAETAREVGISADSYKTVQAHLLKDFLFAKQQHPDMPEENFDMVDLLGLIDYFNKEMAIRLLAKSYELVKPGGVLIFSNMLDENPTLKFNQQVVEWPGVIPFSLADIAAIAKHVAGPENSAIYVPEDRGYGVAELTKPINGHIFERSLGMTALVR